MNKIILLCSTLVCIQVHSKNPFQDQEVENSDLLSPVAMKLAKELESYFNPLLVEYINKSQKKLQTINTLSLSPSKLALYYKTELLIQKYTEITKSILQLRITTRADVSTYRKLSKKLDKLEKKIDQNLSDLFENK